MLHLAKNDIPASLRIGYNGNKFKAQAVTSLTIRSDAGVWSGGTRDYYYALWLANGEAKPLNGQQSAPWDKARVDQTIDLKPGYCIVRHSHFCGKDMGLKYFVHPDDIAKFVPHDNNPALCDVESRVLYIISAYKSFARPDEYIRANIELNEADAIKARLISLGYLNKAGAITVKGRNARAKP